LPLPVSYIEHYVVFQNVITLGNTSRIMEHLYTWPASRSFDGNLLMYAYLLILRSVNVLIKTCMLLLPPVRTSSGKPMDTTGSPLVRNYRIPPAVYSEMVSQGSVWLPGDNGVLGYHTGAARILPGTFGTRSYYNLRDRCCQAFSGYLRLDRPHGTLPSRSSHRAPTVVSVAVWSAAGGLCRLTRLPWNLPFSL
jgi:hypothetical protein